MSNLASLRREIERMKELARERPVSCFCRYVEIVESEPLTEEQERILESNRECRERSHEERTHVGFVYLEIPRQQA